jgi:predicted DNA-binding helix-hairpin-helix protein
MEIQRKVENLSQAAALDCEGPPEISREARQAQFVAHSRAYVTHPRRGKIPVMRIMQTSACEQNCYYCPFQAGRNYQRVWLQPEELALAFDQMQRKKLVDGLFLSSGVVGGGVKAMDRMLDTIELVRRKYEYRGYVHLKIIPGAEEAQLERAARLANRLSINLEGANENRLQFLAPGKNFTGELLPGLYWVRQNQHSLGSWVKPPSVTTQFVVGPAGEADRELLVTADQLYRQANLARAYYSAFNPVPGTPFADKAKTDSLRQHRLYQADWLLRFYGFQVHEIPFDGQGNLPLVEDPKLAWAKRHLSDRPLEINRASRAELLRIPGVGPASAEAILKARQTHLIDSLKHLQRLGVQTGRAAPYILLNGRQPSYQLPLTGL